MSSTGRGIAVVAGITTGLVTVALVYLPAGRPDSPTVHAAAPQFPGGRGVQPTQELVARFDRDGDGRLDSAERHEALAYLQAGGSMRGGRGRGRRSAVMVEPGPTVTPDGVAAFPASVPFYDAGALRTLFFEFDDADWEDQLMAFKETDIEVPATLRVDGKAYEDVGVQFRGASSFMMVPEGQKHSLDVKIDAVHSKQDLDGYGSLNLLNSHEDPSLLRAVLFLDIARQYVPAARANFVRVAINGESWGIYASVQQVDKTFLEQWFSTKSGTRWKVPGSPGARGGLEYFGEESAAYRRVYEMKGEDDPEAWAKLIELTRVLNETPADDLERALSPILDIDGALRFLALDDALVNNDGYWIRASDYNLYLDPSGRFHVLPHDVNETFGTGTGRGFPGGFGRAGGRGGRMREGGPTLDPLVGLDDPTKPLRSKLLAVPALRERYLEYVRDIATRWLDWEVLGPLAQRYHDLIAADVRTDTRKLDSFAAFESSLADLKEFAETRRRTLLGESSR